MSVETAGAGRFRPIFSVWAWLALTPYLLSAFAGADFAADVRELALSLVAAALVHVVLLVAFLAIGGLERLTARRPWLRGAVVVVGLLAVSAGRPAFLSATQQALGFDLVETPPGLRLLMNLLVIGTALVLIHGVIGAMRRAHDVERRLRVVLDALAEDARRIASARAMVSADFQRELAREVLDAFGALHHQRLSTDVLAKELRWIARSVVHRAAEQARAARLDEALRDPRSSREPEWDAEAVAAARAPRLPTIVAGPSWLIAIVMVLLYLPPALQQYGPLPATLLLLTTGVIAFVLGETIRRLPLPRSRAAALTVLGACYLASGAICVGLLLRPLDFDVLLSYYFLYGAVGFAIVATVIVLITSGLGSLRSTEERIAGLVADAEHERFAGQRALIVEALRAGERLDEDVQGDILATAYRIEAGSAGPEALEELIDRIELVLRGGGPRPLRTAPLIRDGLESTLWAWSRTLDITTEVEEDALDWLATHPASAGVAHDAIIEGLMTAVRYGRTPETIVRLRRAGEGVEVAVRSPAGLVAHEDDGIALRDLERRCEAVDLRDTDGGRELRIRLRAGA